MGNSNKDKKTAGASAALASGPGTARSSRWLPLFCVIGLVGAQSWMPAVGLISDMYRVGAFSLSALSSLILPYLVAFAALALLFGLLRQRSAPSSGVYGALVGALLSCLGATLLLLFDSVAPDRVGLLSLLVGLLLGSGNCLMVMSWSLIVEHLEGRALFACSLAVVLGCCALASFSQTVGACPLLLFATVVLSAASAVAYALCSHGIELADCRGSVQKIGTAFVRLGASVGCFGFLLASMIMQFVIAPHGQASWFTWMFGFLGIAAAAVFLVIGRVVRSSWDFLFAYRFAAIPLLVAFFPFDAGSDFSLKYALWFSTMALWCFLAIVPGVVREAAALLRVPLFFVAGIAVCGLCVGAAVGFLVALVVEAVDPSPNYFINVSAILSMALGLIATNIVITRGSLARSFRKASTSTIEDDDSDSRLREQVAMVVESCGLTSREADVLFILARGHGLSRVQEDLFISEGTAITHRRHIYQKLDVHSKSELIDLVSRFGIADCEDD